MLGHVHASVDVLDDVAGFVQHGMADRVQMLDRAVTKHDAVFRIELGARPPPLKGLRGARSRTGAALDASPAYLEAAPREAEQRGVTDRFRSMRGAFTALAENVDPADIVAMHRVICCYPDSPSPLRAAMHRAGRVLVFSHPNDRWFVRGWRALENVRRRLPKAIPNVRASAEGDE